MISISRNKLLITVISVLALFLLAWPASIIRCEILTARHGEEFAQASAELEQVVKPNDGWKVITYSECYAEVYFYSEFGGELVAFDLKDGQWVERTWIASWSASGSADDIIWPYFR